MPYHDYLPLSGQVIGNWIRALYMNIFLAVHDRLFPKLTVR